LGAVATTWRPRGATDKNTTRIVFRWRGRPRPLQARQGGAQADPQQYLANRSNEHALYRCPQSRCPQTYTRIVTSRTRFL